LRKIRQVVEPVFEEGMIDWPAYLDLYGEEQLR
jgi:hypothetical protein